MAATIFEFFGYRADDRSDIAKHAADTEVCPISGETCQKSFNDGVVSGVCAIKPITSEPVICCPIRLYADDYRILSDIADRVFGPNLKLVAGRDAVNYSIDNREACVAVFGKGWG